MLMDSRAFQAIRGAVAEVHLKNKIEKLIEEGEIKSFDIGIEDHHKDFYISLEDTEESIIVECKNVEVISMSSKTIKMKFINYLIEEGYLTEDDVWEMFNDNKKEDEEIEESDSVLENLSNVTAYLTEDIYDEIPSWVTSSGFPRYKFSSYISDESSLSDLSVEEYISSFVNYEFKHNSESVDCRPSVDFQRSRNSTDSDDEDTDSGAMRYYKKDEVDILAVCMFSRSTDWSEFLFCADLPEHPDYPNRYNNSVSIDSDWHDSLMGCVQTSGLVD
jgi:hypothetical protein